MPLWFDEIFEGKARYGLKVKRTLYHNRSQYQTIDIFETNLFGKALALDGIFQTSVGDEYYYHEMLVHAALTTAPSINRVLVIGGGDGGSVREVLRYPEVERVTMVELDHMVVDACKQYLCEIGTAWTDPRLELLIEDGTLFVDTFQGQPFDVIIVDGPDPIGPAEGLIQDSFYRNCRKNLSEDGVMVVQSESPHIMAENFARIVRTLKGVFPNVYPYFGPVPIYASGGWSYTYATSRIDPLKIIETRFGQIESSCRYYNRDIHGSAFLQPNNIRKTLESI